MNISSTLSNAKTKDEFLSKAHEARQARESAREQEHAATVIQAHLKSFHVRHKLKTETLEIFKESISVPPNVIDTQQLLSILKSVIVIYKNSKAHYATTRLLLKALVLQSTIGNNNNQYEHNCLLDSIIRDCSGDEKIKQDWLKVLEYLICFSLNCISGQANWSPEEAQNLALNVIVVNELISGERVSPNKLATNEKQPDENDLIVLKQISEELSNRTHSIRRQTFSKLSESICKIIKGPKTELKSTILCEYVKYFLILLQQSTNDMEKQCNILESTKFDQIQAEVLISFLSVPILIQHIEQNMTKQMICKLFNDVSLFSLSLKILNTNDQTLQSLTSTPALYLLANLIHLGALNEGQLAQRVVPFAVLVAKLLEVCQRNTKQKATMHSTDTSGIKKKTAESTDETYNHILGWLTRETAPPMDQETSRQLKGQLGHLWSMKVLKILFNDLIETNERNLQQTHTNKTTTTTNTPKHATNNNHNRLQNSNAEFSFRRWSATQEHYGQQQSNSMVALRRALERAASTMSKTISSSYTKSTSSQMDGSHASGNARLICEEAKCIAMVCYMLNSALRTLCMIRQDILAGLCLYDYILKNLWTFISSLGPHNGIKAFMDHLAMHTKSNMPEFHILMLFCECASHIISILDDSELYEQQKLFTIDDLISISQFLNTFVYRLITNQLVCFNTLEGLDPILQTTHKLLTDLYKRDCRRKFAPPNHWLMNKELKMSLFLRELEQGKPVAKAILSLLPHVITHKERVLIFRKLVARDKAQYCSGFSTFITIHRSRIVEDGYQQLARLPPNALKGLIRVKFINDYGLDEAGIDQNGVFKEFLEDTIKRVFDPSLNLFSSTSEQRLYPSPTSRLHEDHLSLFNFVGKMLGKAVYEGIVVDVPFASFFLSRVLGQPQSPLYSPIDELPSLDPELYKSLTYIKHYEGDVSQLDLTFSIDQDFVGKIETYELEPGGKFIPVTKESRVRYIHSVANFRMKTQIEEQTEAFVRGFKSIVNLEWLSMFSASEFQRLISGDTAPIDLLDLRKHTKYFGGFHNNHRVICWLWDILEKDFTAEEHRLFLKFITSCSKPPLLGFANLEPPFSIRCVEVSDDQDLGDTVGSVLRGFFAIRRSDPVDRLPTSSTCFNLLKLPNYQRRSTLREKLRYAIQSSTGFELS